MAVHTCYVCDVDAPPFRPAPTPQSAVEWVRQRFCRYEALSPLALMHDDAIELARRCDEAEAQVKSLAHDFTNMHDEVCRLTAQLAAPQSAVEWAKETWDTMWKSVNFSWTEAMSKLIEPLARRCDEAEAKAHNFEHGFHIHSARADEAEKRCKAETRLVKILLNDKDDLRAQLAAAQARADEEEQHREHWRKGANDWCIKANEHLDQLAAAQAEATEMRKQRDLSGKQVLTLTAEINRLRKGITEIKAGTRIGWFMTDLGAKCEKLLNP